VGRVAAVGGVAGVLAAAIARETCDDVAAGRWSARDVPEVAAVPSSFEPTVTFP